MSDLSDRPVKRVFVTRSFKDALKKLKKSHKTDVINELYSVVQDLIDQKVSTQNKNHPLKHLPKDAKGHRDLHLEGGNLVLLYRYETAKNGDNVLIVELRLQDIVDHKELENYSNKKYKAPVTEFDPDEILSSTQFQEWYDSLIEEEQWNVDDVADIENIPMYEDATDTELAFLKYQYETNAYPRRYAVE